MDFDRMKIVMSTYPILALHDFSLPLSLECDTSTREGIGASLMQNQHPIDFKSLKLKLLENIPSTTRRCFPSCMYCLSLGNTWLVDVLW